MSEPMRILTVDVEDWFHILDNAETTSEEHWLQFPSRVEAQTSRLLDLFDRHRCKATFFVLGFIARKYPQLVLEIARHGHEIATHGDMHQLVYRQTPDAFEADLVNSLEAIAGTGVCTPRAYRAPGFSITSESLWALDILGRNGIEVDASIFAAKRAHGGLPEFSNAGPCSIDTKNNYRLRSFPITVGRICLKSVVFSGGGYFRLTPDWMLQRLFAHHNYIMTYFHPRDFDPGQPLVPGLNAARRFRSYVGLKGAFKKLDRLLAASDFISLGQAEEMVDWQTAPVVALK